MAGSVGAVGAEKVVAKKIDNGINSSGSVAKAEDPSKIDTGIGKTSDSKGISLDGEELSDEEIEKIAEKLAEKVKKDQDVEGLDSNGCSGSGTCCGGTTQQQATDQTSDAQSEYDEALQNYNTAKSEKTSADQNVASAKQALESAKSQQSSGTDGSSSTQNSSAISQAQTNYDNAVQKQQEAEQKLQEAEQKLQEAKANLESAQGKQSNISKQIAAAEKNYQTTYNLMANGGSSSFSFAA